MTIRNVLFVQPFSFLDEQLSHLLLIWPIYLENFLKFNIRNLTSDILYLPVEQKRKNLNVKDINDIMDFNFEDFYNQMENLVSNLEFEISSDTIICISASFSPLYLPTKIVAEYFQKAFPSAIIVIGGVHVSAFPQSFLEKNIRGRECGMADFLVIGEGEQALANIIKGNPKKHENPVTLIGEPIINLDDLPPLNFTLFNKYIDLFKELSISLSRGCPYDCLFCSEHCLSEKNLSGVKRWRSYSPKRAVEEARTMINYGLSHNISEFGFVDPVFGLKKSWLNKFLDLYSFENSYFKWCETRLDLMTDDIIKRFESKKILVMYGVESFNHEQLLRLNKTHSPKVYLEKFTEILNVHKGKNIFAINILIGAPGENSLSMNETFNRLEEIISKENVNNVYFNIRYYHHFPFSEFYNNALYFKQSYGTLPYQPSLDWWSSTNLEMQSYGPYCVKPSFELTLKKSIEMYTERFANLIRIENEKLKESKPKDMIVKALMLKKEIAIVIKKRDELFKFLDENNIETNNA